MASATRVLIGFAEALAAPEVAWSLVDAGFQVSAFARRDRHAALRHSRHIQVHSITPPESDLAAAEGDLRKLLEFHESPVVLFPLDDFALLLAARTPASPRWTVVAPPLPVLNLALNKWVQANAARDAGLPVLETTLATTADEVRHRIPDLPLILKPAEVVFSGDRRLSKGPNWICANAEELDRTLLQWKEAWPLLVQRFVGGTGEGIFGLATPEGVSAWSAHRRLRMMNPHGSGSSACVSQSVAPELKSAIEAMVAHTGWRGLFMVELLRDVQGRAWFIEFNGRPWGSMALSRRLGLEYPAWAVHLALDARWRPGTLATSPKEIVCRNVGRELMHLLFVLRGPKSDAFAQWPSFWRSAREVLRFRPGDCAYNWRRDDLKVFLTDAWYTIRDQAAKRRPRHQTRS